jgi:serine/threonine-protein kinase RsbW
MGEIHRLSVAGRYEKIQTICRFVADGAKRSGMDEDAVFHIELACDEACTNIIEHAYGGEDMGHIEVSWQAQGDLFEIIIRDHGRAFDPGRIAAPNPVVSSAPDGDQVIQVGGLGIHFMRSLMDEILFDFDEKNGNTLTMKKRMPPKGAR